MELGFQFHSTITTYQKLSNVIEFSNKMCPAVFIKTKDLPFPASALSTEQHIITTPYYYLGIIRKMWHCDGLWPGSGSRKDILIKTVDT